MSGIATNSSNTVITFNSDFISDFNNNSVTPVPDDEAMAVETYTEDTEITGFTLILESALVVSFDEGCILESINSSQILFKMDLILSHHSLHLALIIALLKQPEILKLQ